MTMPAPEAAGFGLRLNLGGAPLSEHHVVGLPGTYRPDQATPLVSVGLSYEDARLLSDDPGCPVELVPLDQPVAAAPAASLEAFNPTAIPGGDTTDPED